MCITQLYKRKVGRQGIQEHPLGEHWRKWYYTAESEVFVNNPTGRNKLVFSSEEACLLHIRTNKWLLHSKSAYTIQSEILTLGFLCNVGTDCGRDIIHLTSGLMLLWKSMYLANLTGY
jgi:hypothetical protein